MILNIIRDSIVVSIPACHAGDRGSIPRRGERVLLGTSCNFYNIKRIEILTIFSKIYNFRAI